MTNRIEVHFEYKDWQNFFQDKELFKQFFMWNPTTRAWYTDKPIPKILIDSIRANKGNIKTFHNKLIPASISTKLFPYQKECVERILRFYYNDYPGFGLFLQVGLGKTLTALEFISQVYGGNRFIILAPSAIHQQYLDEISKFGYNFDAVIVSDTKPRREIAYKEEHKIMIMTYETFRLDAAKLCFRPILIADEASKLKNPKAKISEVVRRYDKKFFLALTGTPFVNKLLDVYTLVDTIQTRFMWFDYFRNNFCVTEYNEYADAEVIVGYKNIERYGQIISAITTKKTREEVATDLPNVLYIDKVIPQTKLQNTLKFKLLETGGDLFRTFQLMQLLGNGSRDLHSSKSDTANSISFPDELEDSNKLEQLFLDIESTGDEQVIVFTKFKNSALFIKDYLEPFYPGQIRIISGDSEDKSSDIYDFKNRKYKILIATDALTYGVSFSDVNILIHYDLPLSVGILEQRNGRIIRIDSKKPKTIISYADTVIGTYIQKYILNSKLELSAELARNIFNQIKESAGK